MGGREPHEARTPDSLHTPTVAAAARSPRVLIGGVGYRWVRDGSFGLVVSDELMRRQLPDGVEAMDLGYGAIYVTEDLRQAQPPYDRLVLVTAVQRGRTPGNLFTWRWDGTVPDEEEVQACIREAGAGIVNINHLLVIAGYFRALPTEVVVVELEPVETSGSVDLTPVASARVADAVAIAVREAGAPPAVTL